MKKISDLVPLLGDYPEILGETQAGTVTRDTRALKSGDLFFAIRGTQADGHERLEEAFAKGAVAAVIDNPKFHTPGRTLLVDDTRRVFAEACSRFYDNPSRNLKLVGVTGTNGKTTVNYLVYQILSALNEKAGLIGTVEYRIGSEKREASLTTPPPDVIQPLLKEMHEKSVGYVVMEASSIAIEQKRVFALEYDVLCFTNLTQDHLDYHGDMESYFDCKARLFRDKPNAVAVINVDDPYGQKLAEELAGGRVISTRVEAQNGSDYWVESVEVSPNGVSGQLCTTESKYPFKTPLLGMHNIANLVQAAALVVQLGFDLEKVSSVLDSCHGAPGRLECVTRGREGLPLVFVDYAHTPDALTNVLRLLQQLRSEFGGRVITVCGCGGDRDKGKRPKMARAALEKSDVTVLTSDNPRTENPESIIDDMERGLDRGGAVVKRIVDRREGIRFALEQANPGDLVLIAGKGHEDYQILGTEKVPFDDRQVVCEFYGLPFIA